jgi:hypothetical protein
LTTVAGWIFYMRLFHPLSSIPGPFWASISRYWLAYQISTGKAEAIQKGLHDKFGPFCFTVFHGSADVVQDLLCG